MFYFLAGLVCLAYVWLNTFIQSAFVLGDDGVSMRQPLYSDQNRKNHLSRRKERNNTYSKLSCFLQSILSENIWYFSPTLNPQNSRSFTTGCSIWCACVCLVPSATWWRRQLSYIPWAECNQNLQLPREPSRALPSFLVFFSPTKCWSWWKFLFSDCRSTPDLT